MTTFNCALLAPLAAAFGLCTAGTAHGQEKAAAPPPPAVPVSAALPIHQTFSADKAEGWSAFGPGTNLVVAPDAPARPAGVTGGALRFDYRVAKGNTSAMLFPVAPGLLAGAKAFRFLVRADYDTSLLLMLQEKGGGRYQAIFTVPKGTWQTVELYASDFVLADGKSDPADPDNKLDMEQLESVVLTDFSQFLTGAEGPLGEALGVLPIGPHVLYVASVTVSADPALLTGSDPLPPPPATPRAARQPRPFNAFGHPQLDWMVMGSGIRSQRVTGGAPLETQGLRLDYAQAPNKIVALMKPLRIGSLTGRTGFSLNVASVHNATLIVQVEEKGGGKYNATIYIPAGAATATPLSVTFADFKPSSDSKDTNNQLDLPQVTTLMILEATGLTGNLKAPLDNTLYLGELRTTR